MPINAVEMNTPIVAMVFWISMATEALFLGGFFLLYASYRVADPAGFVAAARATWRNNLVVWAALLSLLALTFTLAQVRLGVLNGPIGLTIAAIKAALVLMLFMGLRTSRPIMALAAGAGLFWRAILFALTFSDLLSR
jgi:cytochrome c oxidase subunit IV